MDEMMRMLVMMTIRTSKNHTIKYLTTSSSPTWKLYENPSYTQSQQQHSEDNIIYKTPIRHPSTRKLAAAFWDFTFISPLMETELEIARAKIAELKVELEVERKARKKAESTTKKSAREVKGEREAREALERVCEELSKVISADKAEINRMKKEMQEERKMLRMAEVLREERVQMKLLEAKFVLEERLLELESTMQQGNNIHIDIKRKEASNAAVIKGSHSESLSERKCCPRRPAFLSSHSIDTDIDIANVDDIAYTDVPHPLVIIEERGRASMEVENPHIKRGIKGFVEFPKVVRAVGSKRSKCMGSGGTKLECEKAQLRILLKHRRLLSHTMPSFSTS